jgi:hypothetical protein
MVAPVGLALPGLLLGGHRGAAKGLFHPVNAAAAEQMAAEINILTELGTDMAGLALDRLDWDLRTSLRERVEGLETASLPMLKTGEVQAPAQRFPLRRPQNRLDIRYRILSKLLFRSLKTSEELPRLSVSEESRLKLS